MGVPAAAPAPAHRAQTAFASFARVVRAYRLYDADNQTMVRLIDDLWRQFTGILDTQHELVVTVQPGALVIGEDVVLATTDEEESIPFALYRDGLRRLEFLPGLPREEVEALVETTSFGLHFAGVGEDIVSLLWRKDLSHISYVVVDSSMMEVGERSDAPADGAEQVSVDEQINGLLRALYGSDDAEVTHLSLHLDGADLPAKVVADALCDIEQMAHGLNPVRQLEEAPGYSEGFDREIQEEGDFAISVRGLEGAMNAFADPLPPVEAQDVANAVLRMLDTALIENRFQVAAGIVRGIRASGQSRPLISDWMDEIASDARFRHVTAAFNSRTATRESRATMLEYFKVCGAWAVEPLLGLLPSIADAKLRRAVSNLLLEIGVVDIEPVQAVLLSEQRYVAEEAVFILGHLGTEEAQQALQQGARSSLAPVRAAVAEYSDLLPEDLARNIVNALVLDPDPRVRASALGRLTRFPGAASLAVLENAVGKDMLSGKPMELKRAALKTYAIVAQDQAVHILQRHIRDGDGFLAGKDAEETAVAAAAALARIRTVAAVETLKRTTSSRSKRIKESAKRALVFMKEQG